MIKDKSALLNQRLAKVASLVFRIPVPRLSPETAIGTIEAWDSLGHLQLILEIEEVFKVRFETERIPKLMTLGEIQLELEKRGYLLNSNKRTDKPKMGVS